MGIGNGDREWGIGWIGIWDSNMSGFYLMLCGSVYQVACFLESQPYHTKTRKTLNCSNHDTYHLDYFSICNLQITYQAWIHSGSLILTGRW